MNQLSIRQQKALFYLSEGYSKRKALFMAGYSKSTANQATRVIQTKIMRKNASSMYEKLEKEGLTIDYMAKKIFSWCKSPNMHVQLKAFDIWYRIMKSIDKETES